MSALVWVALALAAVGGFVADRLHVPGGLILGSMVGAAAVSLARDIPVEIPAGLSAAAQVVIGAAIGVGLTRSGLAELGWLIVPAVISGVLIIGAGLGIAFLLRVLHMAPDGDVLATSPGALNVLSSLAVERGYNAVHVAYFHLVRIVMVIVSLPLVSQLLRER